MMHGELLSAVREIRGNKGLLVADEASVKTGVILRLFHILGWNPFDVSEVTPEYAVGGRRVDFALRVSSTNKAFVEVKRASEDLGEHQEQLLDYAFKEGVKLAVLTNGFTWWLYLPLSEGSWEQRRFYGLELLEQDPDDVVKRLEDFLSKERVVSGEAVKSAELVHRSKQTKTILHDSIPKAWNKILTDPDDLLVDLLIETTEKLCGFRPEVTDIEKFLKDLWSPPHSSRSERTHWAGTYSRALSSWGLRFS
jgi:predicted type IV restriction endonuclease